MTIGKKGLDNEYLNPNLCYCAWVVGDSIGRAVNLLAEAGIINPRTGGTPSRMGVWFAARKSEMFQEFVESGAASPGVEEVTRCRTHLDENLPLEKERLHALWEGRSN